MKQKREKLAILLDKAANAYFNFLMFTYPGRNFNECEFF